MPIEMNNRDSVIAIQGGGVLGLTLLGQLEAVIEKHGYVPLALAGTSAGAIVASLVWAGLRPSDIRKKFVEMASADPPGLTSLLGPFEPPPKPNFGYGDFAKLAESVEKELVSLLPGQKSGTKGWRRKLSAPVRAVSKAVTLNGFFNHLTPHFHRRGFFSGDQLEKTIEGLIRGVVPLPATMPPNEPVTFGHVREIMSQGKHYCPPLLLTATNLSRQRLEIFNSIETRYENVPIAKAVRASAGFPVFFRPLEIPECGGGWFVDGGMVSNFPMWVFSEVFRQQINDSPLYRILASKPWIRIGLRVVDDIVDVPDLRDPGTFWKALYEMLSGGARNELEDVLASRAPRSLQIQQRRATTKAPSSILDMGAMNRDAVGAMIDAGRDYANEELKRLQYPSIYNSPPTDVANELSALVQRCLIAAGLDAEKALLRVNVFIPRADRLKMLFDHGMDGDSDRGMEFPNLETGLTGLCFRTRRPHICNLKEVHELRLRRPGLNLFGMPPSLQQVVRKDRTWLASVPIFDPYELHYALRREPDPTALYPAPYQVRSTYGIETRLNGPVLGFSIWMPDGSTET